MSEQLMNELRLVSASAAYRGFNRPPRSVVCYTRAGTQ